MQGLLRFLVVVSLMVGGLLFARSTQQKSTEGQESAGATKLPSEQPSDTKAVGYACDEQLAGQSGSVFRGDQGISPARAVHTPDPKYPKSARRAKTQGAVVLCIIVTSEGNVADARVSRGLSPDLDQTAVDTVKSWTFTPATKDGKPVASQVWTTIWFKIRG